jgi:hypothetical protein
MTLAKSINSLSGPIVIRAAIRLEDDVISDIQATSPLTDADRTSAPLTSDEDIVTQEVLIALLVPGP